MNSVHSTSSSSEWILRFVYLTFVCHSCSLFTILFLITFIFSLLCDNVSTTCLHLQFRNCFILHHKFTFNTHDHKNAGRVHINTTVIIMGKYVYSEINLTYTNIITNPQIQKSQKHQKQVECTQTLHVQLLFFVKYIGCCVLRNK